MEAALSDVMAKLEKENLEGLAHEDALAAYKTQTGELLEWGSVAPIAEEVQTVHKMAQKKARGLFSAIASEKGNAKKFKEFEVKLDEVSLINYHVTQLVTTYMAASIVICGVYFLLSEVP